MMKNMFLFDEGSKATQVICALLINVPVFSYGASIGWMSPMSLLLQSEDSPRDELLTDVELSWMAAIAYLVSVPGAWVLAMLADKIGRKKTLLIISFSSLGSWVLLLCSLKTWVLITARSLVGITMAGCYVICPIYIKEISDDSIRGSLGCLIGVFHTVGNLFLFVIGDILDYHTILWICMAIPLIHIFLIILMPDTPSYLIKTGKDEQALKALAFLRCKPEDDVVVYKELEHVRREQESDAQANKFVLNNIYTDKILSRAFCIALIAILAREACGAVPVLNFAGDIFTAASEGSDPILTPNQQAILLGAVQVLGSVLASSIVEKAGRKPLMFVTSLISGISMVLLASWFLLKDLDILATSWLPLVTLCVCIFCDSAGLQPVAMVVAGEIFSFKYRGTVMAIAMSLSSFSDFLQLLFFKPIATLIGIHAAFYFFAIVCFFISAYVMFVIPETRGRTLEDIYGDLRKKKDKVVVLEKDSMIAP